MRMEIPQDVDWIIEQLNSHGYEAFAVGGCVRDVLLCREPGDWDITTSAKPHEVKAVFGRTIDTGILHGTVTVMKNHVGYEVTTYRIDGEYEDGRHPKSVEFTGDLLEDLKRRDFTINAMAYSHKTGIVDAFEGIKDLKKKKIRCVGNPIHRFTEDALRILRAIRFSAQLGFEIEEETKKAITLIAPNLVHVSKERIQIELIKLLKSQNPEKIKLVYETGISSYISREFAQLPFDKIQISNELKDYKYLRLAAFLRLTTEEEAAKILKDLKLDNETISRTRMLVRWWNCKITPQKPEIRRVMSQMTEELYDSLLDLKLSIKPEIQDRKELLQVRELSEEIRLSGDCVSLKNLAVTGDDLKEMGMKPGKKLGETLNKLFDLVLEHPEYNQKDCLLQKAGQLIFKQ